MTIQNIIRCAIAGLATVICLGRVAAAQVTQPLPIDVALGQPSFPSFMPIALSPDGQLVGYTLEYPRRMPRTKGINGYSATGVSDAVVGCRLWITEVRTGRTLAVGADSATNWGPSWSPDGRWLAYYSDEGGAAQLWVRETSTGRTRRVSDAIVRPYMTLQLPRWTPDSRALVTRVLPVRTPLAGANVRSGADETGAASDTMPTVTVWRADSTRRFGGEQRLGAGSSGVAGKMMADLALIDLATGSVRTLAEGFAPYDYWVAPSGRFVAFTSYQPMELADEPTGMFDLIVAPVGSGSQPPHIVATRTAIADLGRSVSWSPDGAYLLYSATDSGGHEVLSTARAVDWRSNQLAAGVSGVERGRHPMLGRSLWWDPSGHAAYVMGTDGVALVSMPEGRVRATVPSARGYELVALAGDQTRGTAWTGGAHSVVAVVKNDSTKRMGFAKIDLDARRWTILREDDRHYGERRFLPLEVSPNGVVVFRAEDSRHPPDLWSAAPDFGEPRRITDVASDMSAYAYGATRLIHWTTADGRPRSGTLLLPANYRPGARYPLIVYPYPTQNRSDDLNVFGVIGDGTENMQLLATRGFAVLAPDVPPLRLDDQLHDLARVILPGVDRAIAIGVADSTRLGVMGLSWGGYTALALLVQTDRFRAAVMRGGLGDLLAEYGTVEPSGWARGLMTKEWQLGTVWQQRDRYIQNSPIYFFDRVKTPLLMIHGEGETTVPIFLADEVFASLQRLGKEVEFARYKGENHGEGGWTYANQRDYLARMLQWFDAHLVARDTSTKASATK